MKPSTARVLKLLGYATFASLADIAAFFAALIGGLLLFVLGPALFVIHHLSPPPGPSGMFEIACGAVVIGLVLRIAARFLKLL